MSIGLEGNYGRWILVGGVLSGQPFSPEPLIVCKQRLLLALVRLDLSSDRSYFIQGEKLERESKASAGTRHRAVRRSQLREKRIYARSEEDQFNLERTRGSPAHERGAEREGEGKEGTEGICGTLQAFVVTLHGLAVG
jgi:hypothetical protein